MKKKLKRERRKRTRLSYASVAACINTEQEKNQLEEKKGAGLICCTSGFENARIDNKEIILSLGAAAS